jgi:hypothetical protein
MIVFLLIQTEFASAQWAEDVQVITSTPDRLVIKYTPRMVGISTLHNNEKIRLIFEIGNGVYADSSSQIILPGRKILIDVPAPITVEAHLISVQEEAISLGDLLSTSDQEALKQNLHSQSSNLNLSVHQEYLRLSPPGWLRNQRISELLLFPIRFNHNEFLLCREMIIEITFTSTLKQTPRIITDSFFAPGTLLKSKMRIAQDIQRRTMQPKWYRIAITKEGICKLAYQQLLQVGLTTEDITPQTLHIFYGGGRELPSLIDSSLPELREIPTAFFDNDHDGLFEEDDVLVFYAQGTSGWEYNQNEWKHYSNHYTDENVYWLCVDDNPRKEMTHRAHNSIDAKTLPSITIFRDHIYEEQDKKLPDDSGLDWMWDVLSGNTTRNYPVHFTNPVNQDSVMLKVRIQGLAEAHHLVDIYFNDHHLINYDLAYTLSSTIRCTFAHGLITGDDKLRIRLTGNDSSIGFDWYEMAYDRLLQATDQPLLFYSSGNQGWTKFVISGFPDSSAFIFDISDPFASAMIEPISWDSVQTTVSFVDLIDILNEKRYIALSPIKFNVVETIEPVPYDLGAHLKSTTNEADYIIITHKSFLGPALDKLYQHRSNPIYWPFSTTPKIMVVTTDEIYNQFSHGLIDPVAIRNFLKYTFEYWQTAPSFVLLVGDATFDFKDNLGLGKTLLVPSFENSNVASDDWFVNLTQDRLMDMIIGRLPVNTQEELAAVVDKIIYYETALAGGQWRSRILLAADDTYRKNEYYFDDYIFIRDSELLANTRQTENFDIIKIYLERFPWDRVFNKPQAKDRFLHEMNEGVLYINYLGHANWNLLAHENLFQTPYDLSSLHNKNYLPLFYAGTCEVARIDDPRFISMGEYLLLQSEGGVIAAVGSARWTMHQASFNVSKAFYEKIYNDQQRGTISIGQALLEAKTAAGYPDQTEVMFLLGDPALRITVPSYHIDLSIQPDTLSLSKRVIVHGKINNNGAIAQDFSGQCGIRLYDSATNYQNILYRYLWSGKIMFDGLAAVEKGEFETSFFTTADTSMGGNLARLVACAWEKNSNPLHAAGAVDSLILASDSLSIAVRDTVAPKIEITIAGIPINSGEKNFKLTTPFTLSGEISDEHSGFNTTGVQLKLDGQIAVDFLPIELEYPENKKGYFEYEVKNLAPGTHHLLISVYDKTLNMAQWESEIEVVTNSFSLSQVLNYPNPAQHQTFFTFELSQDAMITLKIYTVTGRCIQIIEGAGHSGFNIFPEGGWDCTDRDGDRIANGVYFYKIIAKALDSPFINLAGSGHLEAINKLVIAN